MDTEPEWLPTYTLARQIAEAREAMGLEKWERLNREWNDRTTTEGGGGSMPAAAGKDE